MTTARDREERLPPKNIDEAIERCDAVENPEWAKLTHEEKVARNMCFWMEKYFEERSIRRKAENYYLSAVKGRKDFRSALLAERERAGKLVVLLKKHACYCECLSLCEVKKEVCDVCEALAEYEGGGK